MKAKGRHPHRALTSVRVNSLKAPGRYADGNGLYLLVDPSGAKRWILRVVVKGRGRTDIGLGGLSLVGLSEAREKALQLRKRAREGDDPVAARRAQQGVPTFEQAARSCHTEYSPSWRNPKHRAQWLTTLEEYAFPGIGTMRVNAIDTPDLMRVLGPIWLTKASTAKRVKRRIGVVLDWAKANGYRVGENPVAGMVKGLPKQPRNGQHFAAMPYASVPQFIQDLRAAEAAVAVRLAMEFLVLTATRSGDVLGATWQEIDGDVWTIPAERGKTREHRVPLAPRCMEILKRARELGNGEGIIFAGRAKGGALAKLAFWTALNRMGVKATAHGFRSAFRDWAAEQTNYPREVCEAALAHAVGDVTERAYARSDLFEKRRRLMIDWSRFCTTPKEQAKVLPIRRKRARA